ncbi:H(+)/Cl(-) exchange transporter 3 [Cyphellophora attinorum]|uniref:Chloride channel protein n=1 Tax=Cyphellophora attinorum TaxID=1664694 RepID=A0A0N1GXJ3_9EURO|nr:H(+)/Cl(-) exchange transporter 3 [Phialophora attinorum]KPI35077.1 H(+)/Cl(-) exchange transporter 3 [Phialophora attinorum]
MTESNSNLQLAIHSLHDHNLKALLKLAHRSAHYLLDCSKILKIRPHLTCPEAEPHLDIQYYQEHTAHTAYARAGSTQEHQAEGPDSALNGIGLQEQLDLHQRVWYDQFTSTDWVHDSIQDGHRVLALRRKGGVRGNLALIADAAQGWILVMLIGVLTAFAAYFVDVTETAIFDLKRGVCKSSWHFGRVACCQGAHHCDDWQTWSQIIQPSGVKAVWVDFIFFNIGCITLAGISCFLTLYSRTVVPSHIATTFDENLAAAKTNLQNEESKNPQPLTNLEAIPASIYYSAAGSGVAEVKVILSGFVLHGYLGLRTLAIKLVALIFSVASGMSLGKEGPYVHIATCIGNVACRLFSKYSLNDGKRREVLSASAASGVAVAFGSPLGGVLFSLEEVSYYFPPKTLFRTFFCCIAAALSLKFLNPYGTGKIVLFEVPYVSDWRFFELFCFAFLGFAGGLIGALFIKASRFWAKTFRRIRIIKEYPMLEVLLKEGITAVIGYLTIAFVIKAFLTVITFGIKVPAGIYVPSMVVGGLMGRIFGHCVQYVVVHHPGFFLWTECPVNSGMESCVTPGVYALVAAGATMCGVTRLSVTLAVILFELTGSLDHVLPFSLAVLFAKWTADAVEPLSIYDLLTDMNSYPFLDNKVSPVFDTKLGDITPRSTFDRYIDISISPIVKATELRSKLNRLQNAGELDGGIPLIRNKYLVGLMPGPDLEFALDRIEDETTAMCRMTAIDDPHARSIWDGLERISDDDEDEDQDEQSPLWSSQAIDMTPYIDPAPVCLDIKSPMDLVYQCFVKLGLRYICVLDEGEYRGMVHKKVFVRYVKTEEERHAKGRGTW